MSAKNSKIKREKPYLRKFSIQNFKAFRECTLALAPLTVLIGENSSGKSSLLQALLLLKQMFEGIPGVGMVNLNSPYVQIYQFREVVFGMPSGKATLTFGLEFKDFELSFKIVSPRKDWPEFLEFYLDGQKLRTDGQYSLLFEGLIIPEKFFYNHQDYSKSLYNFFKNIGYIQPIRPAPERFYNMRSAGSHWIGVRAENMAGFLEANPVIKEKVRSWFIKVAKMARNVEFESDQVRRQMEILFTEATTGLEIDISRLGFGFSQILPIVVAAFSEMNMLIFEAPEIHLNPSLHGLLTDLFIEAANNDKQVLVETHSEHVIYRIQRRVAEGHIKPEEVAIYYVRRGEAGSVAERLTITAAGEIPDWPDGFFEAEMEDIYERILAKQ